MKKIVLFVLLSFGMCLFTACSSDNDDKEINNAGGMNLAGEKLVGFSDNEGNAYSDFKYDGSVLKPSCKPILLSTQFHKSI